LTIADAYATIKTTTEKDFAIESEQAQMAGQEQILY
jgi:hypothetical protein